MKIAIPADKPDLEAKVGTRLGTSQYLVVVDLKTMAFEAVASPAASGQSISGIEVVVLAISKKVNAVLTGYCSPTAEKYLSASGIEILTGVSGTVSEVVEQYRNGNLLKDMGVKQKSESRRTKFDRPALFHALKASFNQFVNLLPILVGVFLLIGLFNVFVSKELISSLFSGNRALDALMGACFGALFAGNPINSYIIGGELLEYGVSLLAVTAFIIAWVTVGLVQLPVEISALGLRFALVRNVASFLMSIAIAFTTVGVLNFIKGLFF